MSSPALPIGTSRGWGRVNQNSGTANTLLVTPVKGFITRLGYVSYTNGATAHVLYVMRPMGKTTVASAAASGQAVLPITSDPGFYSSTYPSVGGVTQACNTADNKIAANDYVAYQTADGNWVLDTVASAATLATLNVTTNIPTSGVLAGAPFYWFGINTDTNPANNLAHPAFTLAASTFTQLGNNSGEGYGGFLGSIGHLPMWTDSATAVGNQMDGTGEPIMLYDANGTNAGVIEEVVAIYTAPTGKTGNTVLPFYSVVP